jgi:toxin FitB
VRIRDRHRHHLEVVPRPVRDSPIAATALVHGLSVATRNVADFAPTRVEIVDPWQAANRPT